MNCEQFMSLPKQKICQSINHLSQVSAALSETLAAMPEPNWKCRMSVFANSNQPQPSESSSLESAIGILVANCQSTRFNGPIRCSSVNLGNVSVTSDAAGNNAYYREPYQQFTVSCSQKKN